MSTNNTKISVLVAVYNGSQTIEACINSILKQSYSAEIIVVNDGSTDNTSELLKNWTGQITILNTKHKGAALARNYAASRANGSILVFADADMTFGKNYLKDLVAPILKGKSIGTYTTREKVVNWDSIWARCWNIQEGWQDKMRFPPNPPKWGTDFRAIKGSSFNSVGGFDDIGYTDTWTLYKKLGVKPLATTALCYHHNPGSLASVYKQARWVAKRPYKLGVLGVFIAILRTILPFSILIGILKGIARKEPAFLPFKITYDFGRLVGLFEYLLGSTKK